MFECHPYISGMHVCEPPVRAGEGPPHIQPSRQRPTVTGRCAGPALDARPIQAEYSIKNGYRSCTEVRNKWNYVPWFNLRLMHADAACRSHDSCTALPSRYIMSVSRHSSPGCLAVSWLSVETSDCSMFVCLVKCLIILCTQVVGRHAI